MVENDMRQAVVHWLEAQGMEVFHECVVTHGICDIVGVRFAPRTGRRIPPLVWSVAVELKLARIGEVIAQARGNMYGVCASFAAMPADRCRRMTRNSTLAFVGAGIGLLSVDVAAGTVKSCISPVAVNDGREQQHAPRWWRWHKRNEKKQAATDCGTPTQEQRNEQPWRTN